MRIAAACSSPRTRPRARGTDTGAYSDASQPVIARPEGLLIDANQIGSDHVTLTLNPPPGRAPFVTNITAAPYVAELGGGVVRDGRMKNGLTVLRRVGTGRGPVVLSLAPAGGILDAGRLISLLAIGALWLLLCYTGATRLLKR